VGEGGARERIYGTRQSGSRVNTDPQEWDQGVITAKSGTREKGAKAKHL